MAEDAAAVIEVLTLLVASLRAPAISLAALVA